MALNKDTMGLAIHNVRKKYNEKTVEQLINQYGSMENALIAEAKEEAEAIINHFKEFATIPGTGLAAPNGSVTGAAKIT